jgi:hypothetical protein
MLHIKAFTATEVDKIFSGNVKCWREGKVKNVKHISTEGCIGLPLLKLIYSVPEKLATKIY